MHFLLQIVFISQYLLDLSLTGAHFTAFQPSLMAASAMYVARKLVDVNEAWNPTLAYYSRYSEKDLTACTKAYSKVLLKVASCKFQVIYTNQETSIYTLLILPCPSHFIFLLNLEENLKTI